MNNRLKKMLAIFIFMGFIIPFAIAENKNEETENEEVKESAKFKPVFEFFIAPVDANVYYNTSTKESRSFTWNVPIDLKLGIAIKPIDMLSLTPYVAYNAWNFLTHGGKVDLAGYAGDSGSYGRIRTGLDMEISVLKDMQVLANLGFIADLGTIEAKKGVTLGTGINYELPNIFLNMEVYDSFIYNAITRNKYEKKVNSDRIFNNLEAHIVFNFFQFFMPKFEAGLYSDFYFNNKWYRNHLKDLSDKEVYNWSDIDFSLGFIAKPIDFSTLKTGLYVNIHRKKSKTGSDSYVKDITEKTDQVGLLIYGNIKFGKASAELSYIPYFLIKTADQKVEDIISQNLKLSFSYKY